MFKPLSFCIGLRYTRAKRENHFISFISSMSIIGLVLGVMVLIVVMSVMNGFDRELRKKILGMVPHATILSESGNIDDWPSVKKALESVDGVDSVAPFIEGQGMVSFDGKVLGVQIYGVNPLEEKTVSILPDHMRVGRLEDLVAGEFSIIVGRSLANQLGINVGDKVAIVLPEASVNPAGVFPRIKRFSLVGVFSVGADLDSSLAFIHIDDAARFMKVESGVQAARIKTQDLFRAPYIAWEASRELPGYYFIRDWTQTHGRLFQAIQMEKSMVGLLLTLIIAVAAFNIIATLVMVVTDKQADIAILRTIGATPRFIMMVFIVQGCVIGVFGTFLGGVLGILGALNVAEAVGFIESLFGINFLSADVYFISYLPSELKWRDVIGICSTSLLLSFLATLYPAWRASRTLPAEALRHES